MKRSGSCRQIIEGESISMILITQKSKLTKIPKHGHSVLDILCLTVGVVVIYLHACRETVACVFSERYVCTKAIGINNAHRGILSM